MPPEHELACAAGCFTLAPEPLPQIGNKLVGDAKVIGKSNSVLQRLKASQVA
jgi:hypothetical protein